jgi:hypothetical protein
MTTPSPKIIEGETFDKLAVALSVTIKYRPDGSRDASVAASFIPTRVAGGEVFERRDHAVPVCIGSTAQVNDQATGAAIAGIGALIQQFITDKGI